MPIIFSDIDGTLLNQDHIVTPKTQASIKVSVDKGFLFVPVSARMPEAIRPITEDFGLITPVIAYNGALLQTDDKQTIASHSLAMTTAISVAQKIEEIGSDLAWNIYSYQDWYSSKQAHSLVAKEEDVVGLKSTTVELSELINLTEAHKVLVMCPVDKTDKVMQILKDEFTNLSIAKSLPHLIEIMAAGIDKGQAVAEFADYYQVAMEDTIAFGDNYNDLEMLETVGQAFVMGNAPEALKERISNITLDHNHDGIAAALDKIV